MISRFVHIKNGYFLCFNVMPYNYNKISAFVFKDGFNLQVFLGRSININRRPNVDLSFSKNFQNINSIIPTCCDCGVHETSDGTLIASDDPIFCASDNHSYKHLNIVNRVIRTNGDVLEELLVNRGFSPLDAIIEKLSLLEALEILQNHYKKFSEKRIVKFDSYSQDWELFLRFIEAKNESAAQNVDF